MKYFERTIGVMIILYSYTGLSQTLSVYGFGKIAYGLMLMGLFFILATKKEININYKIIFSYFILLLFTALSIILRGDPANAFIDLIYRIILIITLVAFISQNIEEYKFYQKVLACCVIFVTTIIFSEYFLGIGNMTVANRADALYGNANGAAHSLFLGMLLSITIIPNKYKIHFITICGLGIMLTMSRAGILMYGLAVLLMFLFKIIKLSRLILTLTFFIGIISILPSSLINAFLYKYFNNGIETFSRLVTLSNSEVLADDTRSQLIKYSWDLFMTKPWFGYGLDYSQYISLNTGSHNQYLDLLVTYGIWGIIPIIIFLTSLYTKTKIREYRIINFIFILEFILLGFFTHNLFISVQYQLCVGFVCALKFLEIKHSEQVKLIEDRYQYANK